MALEEYASYDGIGLAELVAKGEVTPSELAEAAIARIDRHNPVLNAVVTEIYDEARKVASRPAPAAPGPFHGVPFVLKDILGDYRGVPTASACRFMQGTPSPFDAELVVRYKRAGFIPLAKTNAPELGLMPTTESTLYGPCRNPWNPDHSTGGSSGGSAAAVAAGIVPIGHANDGGGSIRIPASCCGLVGLKPTRARNPLGPILGDAMNGLVSEHVVTRTVRDSAAVLDCTAGPDVGDPYWAPPPERPYREEVSRDPGRLRIACWTKTLNGEPIHPECVTAVEETARLCADLGHEIVEAAPPIDMDTLFDPFLAIWAAGCTALIDVRALATGRKPTAEFFEPFTWALYERGRAVTGSQYQISVGAIQLASRRVAAFFETHDAWLSPTLAAPPVKLGTFDQSESDLDKAFARLTGYVPFTPIFNATGQPAISLPLHWSADGLPVGVQFAARFGDEGLLYRIAGQLERARPWIDRKPPIWD
ncbi:MAG: amidase family protein [Myxococcales bacterium]|nr:amidase family protein [Myxococcales bacterium]